MIDRILISAFTPGNTDPERLERISVQRASLVRRITERLVRSMTTGDKHHILLVGPRGSGKTHVVTLVMNRLQHRPEVADFMRVAWLGEEQQIAGLLDLALGIADRLAEQYPAEFQTEYRSYVKGLADDDDAAIAILNRICEELQHRNLVLVMENLDRAFAAMKDSGQKHWRAFLQEQVRFATLSTAQQLIHGVASRDEAFFGFFEIEHLGPLSVDAAFELLRRISIEQGRMDLVAFLDSPAGRYRVRALHHLAGGNQRMYVLLSEYLTRDSLDDLISSFERLGEILTPYFQEKMQKLSAQQARLVQCLSNADAALSVKEICEHTLIAEGSCSKQLGILKQFRYVLSSKRGKETFYELAEPLLRLCLESSSHHGQPLRLIARFLKVWFAPINLQVTMEPAGYQLAKADRYRIASQQLNDEFHVEIRRRLAEEITRQIEGRQTSQAIGLIEELRSASPADALWYEALVSIADHQWDTAVRCTEELLSASETSDRYRAVATFLRADAFCGKGLPDLARQDYSSLIENSLATTEIRTQALFARAHLDLEAGDHAMALEDCTRLMLLTMDAPDLQARTRLLRGLISLKMGQTEQSTADFSAILQVGDPETVAEAPVSGHGQDAEYRASANAADSVLPDKNAPLKAFALLGIASAFLSVGDHRRALDAYRTILRQRNLPPDIESMAAFALAEPLLAVADIKLVIQDLRSAFERRPKETEHYGAPGGLIKQILKKGHGEWSQCITAITPLFIEFGAASKLGRALVESIELLDGDIYSHAQLKLWRDVWQAVAAGCPELVMPVRCLNAATDVLLMKSPSDRPLFKLPLEVRILIYPLLRKSLGKPA
jgi:tetratricopeptide (TPR) repeat protein